MQLLKDSKDYENLQKEYDLIKEENQFLNCEITLAEEQIRELEKVLQMVRIAYYMCCTSTVRTVHTSLSRFCAFVVYMITSI